jgi:hypothetical protein
VAAVGESPAGAMRAAMRAIGRLESELERIRRGGPAGTFTGATSPRVVLVPAAGGESKKRRLFKC